MGKFELDAKKETLRRHWYSNMNILYNIIMTIQNKETVFLRSGCVHRCIKANAIKFLMMNFDRYHFFEEPMNLYGSLAHYPRMPIFSFNRVEKRAEMDGFNKTYLNYMRGYDFLMDIDNLNLFESYKSLRKIQVFFKGIPYYVVFSGTKGFHIRVDYQDFPEEFKKLPFPELAEKFKRFGENFSLINNLPDVDYSIYDLRRIAKTPYSIVYPNYTVAMPLSDEAIDNFQPDKYTIEKLINHLPLMRNRGLLKRRGNPENFKQLIDTYTKV